MKEKFRHRQQIHYSSDFLVGSFFESEIATNLFSLSFLTRSPFTREGVDPLSYWPIPIFRLQYLSPAKERIPQSVYVLRALSKFGTDGFPSKPTSQIQAYPLPPPWGKKGR